MASIVDYLNQTGQPSDYNSRAALAAAKGIAGYSGTASQNLQLLGLLQGGGTPAPVPQVGARIGFQAGVTPPTPQSTTPSPQPQAPSPTVGQPQTAQDLVGMGLYGYQGWDNAAALADYRATGGSGKGQVGGQAAGAGGGSFAGGFTPAPTIDFPKLYQNLVDSSGVREKQDQLSQMEKSFIEVKGKINDNPFLSEATRVGRVAKLEQLFNERTANIRGDIATTKADIETQLNLQMKQLDINSQQAQQALSQFNTLLNAGALNNVSGEDIANITRATGLSSSMIQSAVNAKKQKDVQTQLVSFDDGTNQGFAVVDSNTGDIIKRQTVSVSKPKQETGTESSATRRGKVVQLLEANKNSYGHVHPDVWAQILAAFMQDGGTREEFLKNFSQYTDPKRRDFDTTYGFSIDNR